MQRRLERFGRFSMVGLLGGVLQLLLLSLLTNRLRMPVVAAAALAVEIVVLHNFIWHERFTWRDRRLNGMRPRAIRLCRFHAGNGLVSVLGNAMLTFLLVQKLHAPLLLSAVGAITLCSVVNFIVADRWVYPISPRSR